MDRTQSAGDRWLDKRKSNLSGLDLLVEVTLPTIAYFLGCVSLNLTAAHGSGNKPAASSRHLDSSWAGAVIFTVTFHIFPAHDLCHNQPPLSVEDSTLSYPSSDKHIIGDSGEIFKPFFRGSLLFIIMACLCAARAG
ncbi:MAG: hypothetical protein R3231_09205 [bacterium]|nr:hypothetical protein [bacterium]